MTEIQFRPGARVRRKSAVSGTLIVTTSLVLVAGGGCGSPVNFSEGAGGISSMGGRTDAVGGTFLGSGGSTNPVGGGNGLGGAGGAVGTSGGRSGASGGEATGGDGATSGGTTSGGGTSSGGATSGGAGSGGAAPCEDKPYPYDPDWPDANCESWALEAGACSESWFEGYCDITCGRCVPEGGGTGGAAGVDCSGEGLPNVTGGDGFATRYWDCCQPHCSQFNGHRCGQDGTSSTGDTTSSCNGGGSFACYDEAPRAVSDCLSYGHFAKANPNCGACYRIQFTGQGEHNANDPGSRAIKGKQMIVKVTNTGSDVGGNQFDLMIPGGGVGQFNACSRQWGTSDLGAQYGGFLTECTGSHSQKKDCVRQECMKLPEGKARDGCLWFVDWFEVADNPKFTSQQTDCPF